MPVLGGIQLQVCDGRLTAVATDRKCLALAVERLPLPDLEAVIELEVLDVLARHLSSEDVVEVVLTDERVHFRLPNLAIYGRLLSGGFPNYQLVLPQACGSTRAVVDRTQLLELVNGLGRVGRQDERRISLAVAGNGDGSGQVSLSLDSPALGRYRGHVMAQVEGKPVELLCFSDQLAQALRALPADRITLEVGDGQAPITLRAGDSRQLIMPIAA